MTGDACSSRCAYPVRVFLFPASLFFFFFFLHFTALRLAYQNSVCISNSNNNSKQEVLFFIDIYL